MRHNMQLNQKYLCLRPEALKRLASIWKIKSSSLIIGEYCVESETKAKSFYLNFQYNNIFSYV